MKVKNIVRKAVALGSGATLVATSIVGALAYDLSTYPSKYIVDGQFDGKIVVGERAATADVLGSIDIAASLQGASVTKVPVAGQTGTVGFSGGDAFRVEASSDKLELRESVGDVVDTITSGDLPGLKSGRITTSQGSTDFNQYLRLQDGTSLQDMRVNYVENDDNQIADYLVVNTGLPFLEWEIQFPQGLESTIDDDGSLKNIEDRTINIMGTDYTIVKATDDGTGIQMTLMGGSVPDTLREGETKTYTIDGVDYEVTLVFVSDPNGGTATPEVKFSVNGELTQSLQQGETDTLSGGLQIGVRDILVNSREGVASFFLGANKLEITDGNYSNTDFDGTVELNNEAQSDSAIDVLASETSATKFKLSSIKYQLTMDATQGSIAYVPAGHGVRELMRRPESLISTTLDIKYAGLEQVESKDVKIQARGDNRYEMTFTNLNGETYTFPLVSNKDGSKLGNDNDDLVITDDTDIGRNDYFIVSSNNDMDKSVTNVLRYETYDKTDKVLSLRDLSSNSINKVAISGNAGSLIVGGHTYKVTTDDDTNSTTTIQVDLNGDGDNDGDMVGITTWGGARIQFDDADVSDDELVMNATVLAKKFDTSDNGDESFNWTVDMTDTENVDLTNIATFYTGPLSDGASTEQQKFEFTTLESNDEHDVGMTDYGILIDRFDPSGNNNPAELTLSIPRSQRFAQVFVTLGDVMATQGSAGSAERVNPIAVGLAVLDTDAPALGSENLIIVGGPCANTVAAAFMGNPENCGEGFEPGKAMIVSKEQSGHVAILVAGYEATETLGASRVLASYKDYADKLKGTEVEVVVADLNDITVGPRK